MMNEILKNRDFRILCVDDEVDILEALKTYLELSGYNIDIVSSAREALNLIKQTTYHIVLLDINMPDMNGLELLREIKMMNHDIVVIMITAYSTTTKVAESRFLGAFDYLLKPLQDVNAVADAVKRAADHINKWGTALTDTRETRKKQAPTGRF
ncbi:MAG: response regulator [Deltaproteobacteria bacterium]|nr:response regulator [Deltaproteobacteria bacterium]